MTNQTPDIRCGGRDDGGVNVVDARDFVADRAWGAQDLADIDGASVRLHWTDEPYRWHTNNEREVFVVLDGCVDMHAEDRDGVETVTPLVPGTVCVIEAGDRHVAVPRPVARILVIEGRADA